MEIKFYFQRYMPVLEPDLYDPHVESGLRTKLFPYVSGRLWALIVRPLQRLKLLRRDSRPRSLVAVV